MKNSKNRATPLPILNHLSRFVNQAICYLPLLFSALWGNRNLRPCLLNVLRSYDKTLEASVTVQGEGYE